MTDIQIFKNDRFGEVRVTEIEGKTYFVGSDVAKALGYEKPYNAITQHVDSQDALKQGISDIQGVPHNYTLINESGLYSLMFGSKLDSAKEFKRWVTSEVLPTMRKTGGYVANEALFVDVYLPYADYATKEMFRATLSTVRKQNELIAQQRKEIEYKEDVIVGLVDDIDIASKRQILNRVVRHRGADYQERWKVLYREFENKYHINLKARLDRYNQENKPKLKSKLDYIDVEMGKVPELYELAAKLFENDIKELVDEMYILCKNVA